MNRNEFIEKYLETAKRALDFTEKARREGLLALEDELDREKIAARDILEYGLNFVVDGTDGELIERILSNIIEQEKNKWQKTLMLIKKEAVLSIYSGLNPRMLLARLNSYTDLSLNDDKVISMFENDLQETPETLEI
jgi:flagellar motor component MotA